MLRRVFAAPALLALAALLLTLGGPAVASSSEEPVAAPSIIPAPWSARDLPSAYLTRQTVAEPPVRFAAARPLLLALPDLSPALRWWQDSVVGALESLGGGLRALADFFFPSARAAPLDVDTETLTKGTKVSGTFNADVTSDNGASITYREADQAPITIAFDAVVESERIGTTDPHTWTHTPVGTPRAVAVLTSHGVTATAHVLSCTYGGVSMNSAATAADTATEPGRVQIWFLGAAIPTGAQTVSCDLDSGTTDDIHFVSMSFTAAGDTEAFVTATDAENQANPTATLAYGGSNGIAVMVFYSGAANPPATTACSGSSACTLGPTMDQGAFGDSSAYQTTAGTTNQVMGWTQASDDVAVAYAGIRVVAAADYEIEIRYGWVAETCAVARVLYINAWHTDTEDILVQVLDSTEVTWTTRITITATADGTIETYALTDDEWDNGDPDIRFLGSSEAGDTTQTDLLVDLASVFCDPTNTWIAPANGLWSTATNWSLGHKPAAGEDIVFDATSTFNCTVDESIAVLASVSMNAGYTGTVNVTVNQSTTNAWGVFTIASGTFVGGVTDGSRPTNFFMTGGTMNSTVGNALYLTGNVTITGGTWTSGNIRFLGSANSTISSPLALKAINIGDKTNGTTLTQLSAITGTAITAQVGSGGGTATWVTGGFALTGTALIIGVAATARHGALAAGSSVVTINGSVVINTSGSYITATTATFSVSGTWTNSTTSASWDAGTSAVTFTSATGGTMTFAGDNLAEDEFFNVTFTSSAGTSQTFTMATRGLRWGGLLTVSDGVSTTNLTTSGLALTNLTQTPSVTIGAGGILTAGASAITVAGNWDSSAGTFTVGTSLVTFAFTATIASATTSSFANLTVSNGTVTPLNNIDIDAAFLVSGGTYAKGTTTLNVDGGLTLSGGDLTSTSGAVTIAGAVNVSAAGSAIDLGSESWSIAGAWTNASTDATWDMGTGTVTLTSATGGTLTFAGAPLGEPEFFNLTLTSSAGTAQTFTMATRGLIVGNTLTITDGTSTTNLSTSGGSLAITTVHLSVLTGGILTLNGSTLTVSGNLTVTGIYTANTSTLVLSGGATQTIALNGTNVNALSVTGAGRKDFTQALGTNSLSVTVTVTFRFTAGITWTHTGLTISASLGNILTLESSVPLSIWALTSAVGVVATRVSVSDSTASAIVDACDGTNVDGGGNTNWDFCAPDVGGEEDGGGGKGVDAQALLLVSCAQTELTGLRCRLDLSSDMAAGVLLERTDWFIDGRYVGSGKGDDGARQHTALLEVPFRLRGDAHVRVMAYLTNGQSIEKPLTAHMENMWVLGVAALAGSGALLLVLAARARRRPTGR